jgi:hypothetical protein
LGLLASCYSPDVSGVHYSCTAANPICPDGTTCIAGSCLAPGTPLPPGCRSGVGTQLSDGMWACAGQFAPAKKGTPTASQLCADGYALCSQAGGADLGLCKTLPGFFAANSQAAVKGTDYAQASCSKPVFGQSQLWVGCGTSTGNKGFTTPACAGFTQVLDCSAGNDGWNCGFFSTSLDALTNSNDSDGVLCCISG